MVLDRWDKFLEKSDVNNDISELFGINARGIARKTYYTKISILLKKFETYNLQKRENLIELTILFLNEMVLFFNRLIGKKHIDEFFSTEIEGYEDVPPLLELLFDLDFIDHIEEFNIAALDRFSKLGFLNQLFLANLVKNKIDLDFTFKFGLDYLNVREYLYLSLSKSEKQEYAELLPRFSRYNFLKGECIKEVALELNIDVADVKNAVIPYFNRIYGFNFKL